MYFKKLYHTNKWLFGAVVLFTAGQLYINLKQGVVISPMYHYGMYSGVIKPQARYVVTEIKVNGKPLRVQDFTPQQWDKISYTLQLFQQQRQWNSQQWNNDIKRLLHVTDSTRYINNITGQQFNTWYKNYLEGILHHKVDSVAIDSSIYLFDGNSIKKN